MKDCGDFQDPEFRKLLINCLKWNLENFLSTDKGLFNIINILEKEDFKKSDILRFYFECYKVKSHLLYQVEDSITRAFFEYKMKDVSDEQLIKFAEIVKKMCPYTTSTDYSALFWSALFEELVEIFLKEI